MTTNPTPPQPPVDDAEGVKWTPPTDPAELLAGELHDYIDSGDPIRRLRPYLAFTADSFSDGVKQREAVMALIRTALQAAHDRGKAVEREAIVAMIDNNSRQEWGPAHCFGDWLALEIQARSRSAATGD